MLVEYCAQERPPACRHTVAEGRDPIVERDHYASILAAPRFRSTRQPGSAQLIGTQPRTGRYGVPVTAPRIGKYAWLSDGRPSGLGEAGCVMVVSPAASAAVLDAFAADPAERVEISEASLGVAHVAITQIEGAVVAYEVNGFEGSRMDVLERASRGGKAASVFWNVNGVALFAAARRGRVVCSVDLLLGDDPVELPARLRKLLPADPVEADLVAVGAAMVEVFTGIAVTPDMLSAQRLAYVVHPRPEPLDTMTVEDCALADEYPDLVSEIAAASDPVRRAIAEWSARQALRQVELLTDAAVQTVTSQFGGSSVASPTVQFMQRVAQVERDQARAYERYSKKQYHPHEPYWVEQLENVWANQRSWAMLATRYACQEDDLSAALGAVQATEVCFRSASAGAQFAAEVARLMTMPPSQWPEQPSGLPAPPTADERAEWLDWVAWKPRFGDDVRVPALEPWQRGHERLRQLRRSYSLDGLEPETFDLEQQPEPTRRAIAVWAAHCALDQAGLATLSWIAPALAALDAGQPLPPPFDDPAAAWARLDSDSDAPRTYVTAFDGQNQDHQQAMAVPVLAAAALPDATQAATNALWYAMCTAGLDYGRQVIGPLRKAFDL